VVIQWDPERDFIMENLITAQYKIGLRGEGVNKYVNGGLFQIKDITSRCTSCPN